MLNYLNSKKYLVMNNEIPQNDFKPKGAMAFFAILTLLGVIIWFGIYFLMLHRQ